MLQSHHAQGCGGRAPPVSAGPDRQDLVSLLLAGAVQASHAIEQLHRLAAGNPGADPAAAAEVAEAITTMNEVRARLLRDADVISDGSTPP